MAFVSVVAVSTAVATPSGASVGDGPVLVRFGANATWVVEDGGKRWADDPTWSCLVDAGMAGVEMPWAELDGLPDNPGGSYQCDEFSSAGGGDSSTGGDSSSPSVGDGPVLVRFGANATWVVEDGGKRWADDPTWSCLVDAGMAGVEMPWAELDGLPDNPGGSYQCDEFSSAGGGDSSTGGDSSSPSVGDGPVLVRFGANATWVVEDGGKRWADDPTWSCLVDAGMAGVEMPWAELDGLPDNPGGSYQCDEFSSAGGGSEPQVETAVAILTTADKGFGSDGWFRHADGTKQWIDSQCRELLTHLNAPILTLSWSEISGIENGPTKPCDKLSIPDVTVAFASFDLDLSGGVVHLEGAELHVPDGVLAEPSRATAVVFTTGTGDQVVDFHIEPPTWDGEVKLRLPGQSGDVIYHRLESGEVVAEPTVYTGDGYVEAFVTELSGASTEEVLAHQAHACTAGAAAGLLGLAIVTSVATGGWAALAWSTVGSTALLGCATSVAVQPLPAQALEVQDDPPPVHHYEPIEPIEPIEIQPLPPVVPLPPSNPSPPANPNPPAPVGDVTLSKGASAQGQEGCSSSYCRWMVVNFAALGPGPHRVTCNSSRFGEWHSYTTYQAQQTVVCYYGYPGDSVWATVAGQATNAVSW